MEELMAYFENAKGLGVIATSDKEGKVNAAVYSRPHFLEDGSLAFIMRDRLTHTKHEPALKKGPRAGLQHRLYSRFFMEILYHAKDKRNF